MIIVAGGDSFIWGSELADSPHGGPNGYSRHTFTALLSHGHQYVCAAYPGNANDSISRQVINSLIEQKNNKTFVIVSWTFPGRYEFNFGFDSKIPNWQVINHWTIGNKFYPENKKHKKLISDHVSKAKINNVYDFAVNYFQYVASSEYWETYTTIKEILFLQSFLQSKKIPYLFTCADASFLRNSTILSNDLTIDAYYENIDFSKWFFFPDNKGFYEWATHNKYPIGDTHPLEAAHRDAAELMKDKFYEMVKKDLE